MTTAETFYPMIMQRKILLVDRPEASAGLYKGRPSLRSPRLRCDKAVEVDEGIGEDDVFDGCLIDNQLQSKEANNGSRKRPPLRIKKSNCLDNADNEHMQLPSDKQRGSSPGKLCSAPCVGPYAAFLKRSTETSTSDEKKPDVDLQQAQQRSESVSSSGSTGSEELLFGDYKPYSQPSLRIETVQSPPASGDRSDEAEQLRNDTPQWPADSKSGSTSPNWLTAQCPKMIKNIFRRRSDGPADKRNRSVVRQKKGQLAVEVDAQGSSPGSSKFSFRRSKTLPPSRRTDNSGDQVVGENGEAGGAPFQPTNEMRILHRVVTKCVEYLEQPRYLREEGLFRMCGSHTEISKLRQAFIHGQSVNLSLVLDPHTVAGLLKLHLRELRFSLVPCGDPCKRLMQAARTGNVTEAKAVLKQLPFTSSEVVRLILDLLRKVVNESHVNKMSLCAIGKSVGPSLFRTMGESNSSIVLRFLVANYSRVTAA